MRSQLLIVCGLALLAGSAQADESTIIDGRWVWTLDAQGNTINSELVLHTDGEKLTGSYKDQNVTAEITDGGFDDLNVWFDMSVTFNGADIDLEFSGEYSSGSIEGSIDASVNDGEESAELPWNAKRETRNRDVVGQWVFELDAPDGVTYRPELTVSAKNGKLAGKISADDNEMELKAITLKKNVLSFQYTVPYEGSDLQLTYNCLPRGNKMRGEVQFSVDGNDGTIDIKAVKKTLDKRLLALVGSWKCSTVGPDGVERKPVLTAMVENGKLVGHLKSEEIDVKIDELKLDGDYVSFPFTNSHDGNTIDLVWKCKADGDKMTGIIEFDFDGNSGSIDVSGNKQAD